MRILAFSALALGLGLTFVQATACSNSADDCNATATCGATAGAAHAGSAGKSGGGDGSDAGADSGGTSSVAGSSSNAGNGGATGSGGEGGGSANGCTGDVSDDAACWTTDELGVFVSSDAVDDTGDGTKEAPFKTIAKGIAAAAGKNVYVCVGAGDYTEKVSLDLASDGIHIYGGFECANWTYATTRSAQVLSPSNIALRVDGLKKGAHIENMSFQAADATGTGPDASSYGAFVTGSKGVVLTRVELKAGKGAKGVDGADGAKGTDGAASGAAPAGSAGLCPPFPTDPPPTISGGKWTIESACASQGGPGGTALKTNTNGAPGGAGAPTEHVSPLANIENGGPGESTGVSVLDGKIGTQGDAGLSGEPAAAAGVLSATGFAPADGKSGGTGFAGQGGGGGGASKGTGVCFGASGGAGGMGGCGGLAGKAGGGGGASVGLFSLGSQIALTSSSVQSGVGGAGGKGGKGGQRGLGAVGGTGGGQDPDTLVSRGGTGGFGGNGGPGGNGSGGTGGPSYALVYSDAKPTFDIADTTLKAGTPGAAGVGGEQVGTTKAPNGSVGAAAAEFEIL